MQGSITRGKVAVSTQLPRLLFFAVPLRPGGKTGDLQTKDLIERFAIKWAALKMRKNACKRDPKFSASQFYKLVTDTCQHRGSNPDPTGSNPAPTQRGNTRVASC